MNVQKTIRKLHDAKAEINELQYQLDKANYKLEQMRGSWLPLIFIGAISGFIAGVCAKGIWEWIKSFV